MQPTYHFSTSADRAQAMKLLVFLAHKLPREGHDPHQLDHVHAVHMGGYANFVMHSEEEPRHCFQLGLGVHCLWYEKDTLLTVRVTSCASQEQPERCVTFKNFGATLVSKQFSIEGIKDADQMQRLMQDASTYVLALLKQEDENGRALRVGNFLYDTKDQYYTHMGYLQQRDQSSLFLKETEGQAIFDLVDCFLKAKEDYKRCSVPYKLNILLHGLPGTGKTSVITTLASHFGLNVAVIPFTPKLTDEGLAQGITQACLMGCRIIALEDVDCLFSQARKPGDAGATPLTLSGLLNCMDGLLRGASTGLIMILTANTTEDIDEAVLRTARVDFSMLFTHADQYQTRKCFDFYSSTFQWDFTEAEWALFWEAISCLQFTTALLQQFFFMGRRKPRATLLSSERFKQLVYNTGKEGTTKQLKEKRGWFYN